MEDCMAEAVITPSPGAWNGNLFSSLTICAIDVLSGFNYI